MNKELLGKACAACGKPIKNRTELVYGMDGKRVDYVMHAKCYFAPGRKSANKKPSAHIG